MGELFINSVLSLAGFFLLLIAVYMLCYSGSRGWYRGQYEEQFQWLKTLQEKSGKGEDTHGEH